ncbi:MAG: type I pantothenate kinase [Alphaproteobacteria bacterium]
MAFQQHPRAVLSKLQKEIPASVMSDALIRLAKGGAETQSAEFIEVYLPLACLIHQRVSALQTLRSQTAEALGAQAVTAPFLIGLAGSVAVGKSTSAKFLQHALAAWPDHSDVSLVTSDGFLFPNAELKQRGIMERKGFPESFDASQLVKFLTRLKSGETGVAAPLYSHVSYDVMPDQQLVVQTPHIVIVEGINVLQPQLPDGESDHSSASDFFDYSIYVHAEEALIRQWYTARFLALTQAAVNDPQSFYSRFAPLSPEQRLDLIDHVWTTINGKNLANHILPTRPRADLILHKGPAHGITHFELRNR